MTVFNFSQSFIRTVYDGISLEKIISCYCRTIQSICSFLYHGAAAFFDNSSSIIATFHRALPCFIFVKIASQIFHNFIVLYSLHCCCFLGSILSQSFFVCVRRIPVTHNHWWSIHLYMFPYQLLVESMNNWTNLLHWQSSYLVLCTNSGAQCCSGRDMTRGRNSTGWGLSSILMQSQSLEHTLSVDRKD